MALVIWANAIDPRGLVRLAVAGISLLYGVAAFVAAFGVWRMQPWASWALRAWAVASFVASWIPVIVRGFASPLWVVLVGNLLLAGVLLGLVGFLERGLLPTA